MFVGFFLRVDRRGPSSASTSVASFLDGVFKLSGNFIVFLNPVFFACAICSARAFPRALDAAKATAFDVLDATLDSAFGSTFDSATDDLVLVIVSISERRKADLALVLVQVSIFDPVEDLA